MAALCANEPLHPHRYRAGIPPEPSSTSPASVEHLEARRDDRPGRTAFREDVGWKTEGRARRRSRRSASWGFAGRGRKALRRSPPVSFEGDEWRRCSLQPLPELHEPSVRGNRQVRFFHAPSEAIQLITSSCPMNPALLADPLTAPTKNSSLICSYQVSDSID
jgi:hypothetical protein